MQGGPVDKSEDGVRIFDLSQLLPPWIRMIICPKQLGLSYRIYSRLLQPESQLVL